VQGAASRRKRIELDGLSEKDVSAWLSRTLAER
jgi:hypothetical protein